MLRAPRRMRWEPGRCPTRFHRILQHLPLAKGHVSSPICIMNHFKEGKGHVEFQKCPPGQFLQEEGAGLEWGAALLMSVLQVLRV